MSEPSNEIAAPAAVGEPVAESINWGDAPPAPPAPAAEPAQTAQEPAAAPPVVPAAPAAEPNPDFTFSTLENGERELRLATGQVYKGKDDAGILEQVTRAQLEASRTITQLRSQQPPAPVQPVAELPKALDPTTMAIIDLIAPGFGAKTGQELVENYRRLQAGAVQGASVAQQMEDNQSAIRFLTSNPDFVNTPTNSQKLDAALVAMNLPFTAENAQWAHYALKGQGLYETPAVVAGRDPATGQFMQRTNLMPMPPNASTPAPATPAPPDPWAMSDADFDKAFRERMSA